MENEAMKELETPVRLGVLVPSVNTIVEPDMYRLAPPGFSVHFSRLPVPSDQTTVENLLHLEDHLEESLQSLSHAKIKAVAFACTSGSFIKGPQWDRRLIERMEQIVSPATTTSDSVVSALEHLEITNFSLVTPYPDPINELMTSYFHAQGFHIVNLKSLGLPGSEELRSVPPDAIFDLAKSADTNVSEAILISCTDFRALAIVNALEESIHKPVITANQATFWKLMELSGKSIPVKGYGYLLSEQGMNRLRRKQGSK